MDGNIVDYAKEEILKAMYRSVDRMNRYCLEGTASGIASERDLQKRLRESFRALQERQETRG